jgi:secretion/DNA translocation related TadE-like protein
VAELPDRAEVHEGTDRGSGTVLMAVVMVLAGFLITVTLMLASAIVARHRAGAIADLSALAAASVAPAPDACERARRVAAANAGRLVQCRILGDGSVLVGVELAASNGGPLGPARGSARAGRAGRT